MGGDFERFHHSQGNVLDSSLIKLLQLKTKTSRKHLRINFLKQY